MIIGPGFEVSPSTRPKYTGDRQYLDLNTPEWGHPSLGNSPSVLPLLYVPQSSDRQVWPIFLYEMHLQNCAPPHLEQLQKCHHFAGYLTTAYTLVDLT